MARITHPLPEAGKQTFIGITFRDGHADFDLDGMPHLRESLVQHGFTVEDSEPDDAARPAAPAKSAGRGKESEPAKVPVAAEPVTADPDSASGIQVGSLVRLSAGGRELLGGDADAFAEVLSFPDVPEGAIATAVVSWSDDTETTITLSLIELVPVD